MNREPRIEPTFSNNVDQNPKAVVNQHEKEEADRWDPQPVTQAHWSAACPLWLVGSSFFQAYSRVF